MQKSSSTLLLLFLDKRRLLIHKCSVKPEAEKQYIFATGFLQEKRKIFLWDYKSNKKCCRPECERREINANSCVKQRLFRSLFSHDITLVIQLLSAIFQNLTALILILRGDVTHYLRNNHRSLSTLIISIRIIRELDAEKYVVVSLVLLFLLFLSPLRLHTHTLSRGEIIVGRFFFSSFFF